MSDYLGSCHCGALQLRYRTVLSPSAWSLRACQCSFCRAHAGLTTSDPNGALWLSVDDDSLLQRCRFGTGITEFWLCRRCGVYLAATMEGFGVFNVRVLRPAPADLPEPMPMQYGEESADGRRVRRIAQWTPLMRPD